MINRATELWVGVPVEFEIDIHRGAYHWVAEIATDTMTIKFCIEDNHFEDFVSRLTAALKPFVKPIKPLESTIQEELRNIAFILSDKKGNL